MPLLPTSSLLRTGTLGGLRTLMYDRPFLATAGFLFFHLNVLCNISRTTLTCELAEFAGVILVRLSCYLPVCRLFCSRIYCRLIGVLFGE